MKLFEDTNNVQVELSREQDFNHEAYKVEINSLQLFYLMIDIISYRTLFQILAHFVDVTKTMLYMD